MTTLYVTDQGAYLRVKHQQFQVFHRQELRCSVPASQISHVVMFGACTVSHGAVRLALQRRIPLLYLSNKGRYFGRLQTTGQAKLEYLTQQVYKAQDPEYVRTQAASTIVGKLHNSRILLLRLNRRRKTEKATQAIATLTELMETVPTADSVEAMLGYGGGGEMGRWGGGEQSEFCVSPVKGFNPIIPNFWNTPPYPPIPLSPHIKRGTTWRRS